MQLQEVEKSETSQPTVVFKRDPSIWTYYSIVGLNCYITAALGPLMPFLRADLHLDYKTAGLHFSAFAIGTIFAGSFGDIIANKLGRVVTLASAILVTIASMVLLITASTAIASIAAVMISGFCASLTYQTLASAISDHLDELRTFAFLEAEVVAMLVAGIAPFAIGACVSMHLGWRAAIILLIAMYAVCLPHITKFGKIKSTHDPKKATGGKLSNSFWLFGAIIFLSCAVEWSTAFWSADYLVSRLAMTKAAAAAAVGAFFVGMVVGRFGGSRLVHVYTASQLLVASGLMSIAGFAMFWLGDTPILNVAGLLLTGLGIANMYPLAFSSAVAISPSMRSTAIARVSLLAGSAILIVPLALSFIADKHGLFNAYSTVAVIVVLCFGSIITANKIAVQQQH